MQYEQGQRLGRTTVTGTSMCPNGHASPPGNRFCTVCGAAVPTAVATPPPAPPPVQPPAAAPAFNWLPVIIGAAALVTAAIVATVILTGDDGGTSTTVAMTTAQTIPATTPSTPPPETIPSTTPAETTPPTGPGLDPDSWTVLVYMIGDNDLEENALEDLLEMSRVTPQERLNIVVLIDRSAVEITDPALGFDEWSTARLLKIEGTEMILLGDPGEIDMGDPAVLTGFVADGIVDHPASHYALILWDHGSTLFGIGPDEGGSMGTEISPAQLMPAIRAGLDMAGLGRLDIIGFDACLMGSLETATAVAPIARYMIASEDYEPVSGWDWTSLEYLATEPNPTAEGLSVAIVQSYHESVIHDPDHTLSAVNLDMIDEIELALAELASPLVGQMDSFAALLGRQRGKVTAFGKHPDPWAASQMIDLGHLLQRLARNSPDLADQAREALRLIEDSVIAVANGANGNQALGIAVYFPSFPEYWVGLSDFYDQLESTAWRQILDAFFVAGSDISPNRHPTFDPIGSLAHAEFVEPSGLHISAGFAGATPGNITEVHLLLGISLDEGSTVYYSDYPGEVNGTTATAVHGLERVFVDDGGLTGIDAVTGGASPVFHRITRTDTDTGSVTSVEIPFAYYAPGVEPATGIYQNAVLMERYVYTSATDDWTSGRELFVTTDTGTVGAVSPDPAGSLVPVVLQETSEGIRTWTPFLTGRALSADLDALTLTIWTWGFPGDRLAVALTVTDFGGNTASAYAVAVVPDNWQTAVG